MADRDERCERCRYWDEMMPDPDDGDARGHCLRFPPVADPCSPRDGALVSACWWVWPLTLAEEWCGEFRPKEGP